MRRRSWRNRDWVSTLEAARLLGICHMTVIRRFDAGQLAGYRVPGSRYRRIPKRNLVDYARRNNLPEPDFEGALAGGNGDSHHRRALVVEDDHRMASLMERFLRREGWEVSVARTGFDAGLMAGTLRPLLVLLDIMLPGLDGREACRRMRANPELSATRILAVTALRDPGSVDEIFAAGVDAYLPKPFALKELKRSIDGLTATVHKAEESSQEVKDSSGATDEL